MSVSLFKFFEFVSEKNSCFLSFLINFQNQVLRILLDMICLHLENIFPKTTLIQNTFLPLEYFCHHFLGMIWPLR